VRSFPLWPHWPGCALNEPMRRLRAIVYLAALVGPTLADVLIAHWGASNVLWLDAATFGLSALLIALAVPALAVGIPPDVQRRSLSEIAAGLRFIRQDPLRQTLLIGLGFANFCGLVPLFSVVLPVFVSQQFGNANVLGARITSQGFGALFGAIAFGAVGQRLPRRPIWLVGFLVGPLRLWAVAVDPPLPNLAGVLMLCGVVSGMFNPLLNTLRHERVPNAFRGRVFGTFAAIASVAAPLGVALAGLLIDATGFATTVIGMAVGAALVGAGVVSLRSLSAMSTTHRPLSRPD